MPGHLFLSRAETEEREFELRYGTQANADLIHARGERECFRSYIQGQIKTIRTRRKDGSYYPDLMVDLHFYVRQWRVWNRRHWTLRRANAPAELTLPDMRDRPEPVLSAPLVVRVPVNRCERGREWADRCERIEREAAR